MWLRRTGCGKIFFFFFEPREDVSLFIGFREGEWSVGGEELIDSRFSKEPEKNEMKCTGADGP